jgi:predicted nuclease with TOPRIM domain
MMRPIGKISLLRAASAIAAAMAPAGCDQVTQDEYDRLVARNNEIRSRAEATKYERLNEVAVIESELERYAGKLREVEKVTAALDSLEDEIESLDRELEGARREFEGFKAAHPLPAGER